MRVAVVGSGPAGLYAADALAKNGVAVDIVEALPCPFGLVRYGVAPDHPKIKSIARSLQQVFEQPGVRFLGNVSVGTDVSRAELRERYDAVVYATGAALGRPLGIPGEELSGVRSATDFVAWYSGHPDAEAADFELTARSAVVIGVGNVAVDVARLLIRSPDELAVTDIPSHVLATLRRSTVEEVHVVGRRGPAWAAFTTKELRELGGLAGVDVVVDPTELELDDAGRARLAESPTARRNLDALTDWARRPLTGAPRRVHLRFWLRPVTMLGTDAVEAVEFERTALGPGGAVVGTGDTDPIKTELVLTSVGYRAEAPAGLPFDGAVVPHDAGRVLDGVGPVAGEYVAGWIKRGPTGLIGTNRQDAGETVRSLLADLGDRPGHGDPDALPALLAGRGVQVVTWAGWEAIAAAEVALGQAEGRDRAKITDRSTLHRIGTAPSP